MIKAIIFDFDGVIADSEHINIEGGVRTFREFGHELTDDEREFIVGKHSRDVVSEFMKTRKIDASEDAVVERYRQIYDVLWQSDIQMMPAVQEVLRNLKERNVTLALATSNRESRVNAFFGRFNLDGLFSVIVGSEKITKRKPDPEVYLKAIKELGLSANEMMAVEDSEVGLKAAKAAGLRCAVIPNRYTKNHNFEGADFILRSPSELFSLL